MDRKILVQKRLAKEKKCGRGLIDNRNKTLYIENIPYLYRFGKEFLHLSGIYDKWYQNALAVKIRHESWHFKNLPAEFDGFRILQISDLHIDALPELSEILPKMINKLDFDLCVFTGDFRFDIHCGAKKIDKLLQPVISASNQAKYPALAILGNHDYLEYTVDNVEKMGLKFLLNESIWITKANSKILITGLDDVHYYRTGRLFDHRDQLAEAEFKLLLIHSPEYYREAALAGYDLYLCGHTHGGQICLPGGIPIISNCRCPLGYVKGRWSYRGLQGFTTTGTGASGIPLRWNCPPEITLHRLGRN